MAREKDLWMPSFGLIEGGRLHGWRYHFLWFIATPAELLVHARCSPPAWPFPCDIKLNSTHYRQLQAVPGERAKRFRATPLIVHAYQLAGLEIPK